MRIITNILIGIIKIYKMVISPYLEYAIESLKTYGLVKGFYKSTKRILSCHPFSKKSGFDPVPNLRKGRK